MHFSIIESREGRYWSSKGGGSESSESDDFVWDRINGVGSAIFEIYLTFDKLGRYVYREF